MEKSNKLYLIIIIVCTILVVGLCAFAIYNHKDIKVSDSVKFKEEYEAYNGLVNENNDKNFLNVEISKENPIIYKSGKQILDVLKNEDALVYFGFSSCPWCRRMIEPMLETLKNEKIDKIYYVDIFDMRDTYKFTGSIIPEQTKKGTDAYYDILEFLGKNLEEYYVKDDAGNMYDTGVTRLYAPTIVSVSNGKVIGFYEQKVDSKIDPYEKMSEDEKNKFQDMLKKMIVDLGKLEEVSCVDKAC